MANVQFDDENTTARSRTEGSGEKSGITGWIQEKFGLSKAGTRKLLIGVAVAAFLASLYFWFGLLF